ncbi:hypothetical protein GGR57DRAFT_502027 [Xylariaceae sp. FL1272]|nr:hypothetical protein GGR57DRAFT_502027 [Xylariaceae sp. FL1272]
MAWNGQYKGNLREQAKHAPNPASSPGNARVPVKPWYIERPPTQIQTAAGTRIIPGRLVPVIFADQLPEWLEIKGIPRELNREQVAHSNYLGIIPGGDTTHDISIFGREVHFDPNPTSATGLSADAGEQKPVHTDTSLINQSKRDSEAQGLEREVQQDEQCTIMVKGNTGALHQRLPSPPPAVTGHDNPYQMLRLDGRHPTQYGQESFVHPADRLRQAFEAVPPASPSEPKTIYCLYWTKNGECREDRACAFKHEMPDTKEELQKVGISNNFPAWYREELAKKYIGSIKNKKRYTSLGLKEMADDYLRRVQLRVFGKQDQTAKDVGSSKRPKRSKAPELLTRISSSKIAEEASENRYTGRGTSANPENPISSSDSHRSSISSAAISTSGSSDVSSDVGISHPPRTLFSDRRAPKPRVQGKDKNKTAVIAAKRVISRQVTRPSIGTQRDVIQRQARSPSPDHFEDEIKALRDATDARWIRQQQEQVNTSLAPAPAPQTPKATSASVSVKEDAGNLISFENQQADFSATPRAVHSFPPLPLRDGRGESQARVQASLLDDDAT